MRQRFGARYGVAHSRQVRLRTERPQFGAFIVRCPGFQACYCRAEFLHQPFINALLRVNSAGRRTILPGVVETKGSDAFHHRIYISVVKHNHRRFAAQFHMRALNRRRRVPQNVLSSSNRTGQRYHPYFGVPG